jgi:hypothetical protein
LVNLRDSVSLPLEELQNKRARLGDVPVDVFYDPVQQIPLGFDVIR